MPNVFEQGLLRYLTRTQLDQIQKQRVGIGGAGGLGSNVALILVRSGFKNLEIIDQDVIDPSNLNRQQYYIHEVGQDKVLTLKSRLLDVNPDLNIRVVKDQWRPDNGSTFFTDASIVVEAFDQAKWKYSFVEFYRERAPFVVSGNGMAGLAQKQTMTVKKMGNIYFVGDLTTDSAEGHPPMAPRVTACAAKMAEIVLDLTLGIPVI